MKLTFTSSPSISRPLDPCTPFCSFAASPTLPIKRSYISSSGSGWSFTLQTGCLGCGRKRKGILIAGGVCCHRGVSWAGCCCGAEPEKAREIGWALCIRRVRAQAVQMVVGREDAMIVWQWGLGWVRKGDGRASRSCLGLNPRHLRTLRRRVVSLARLAFRDLDIGHTTIYRHLITGHQL